MTTKTELYGAFKAYKEAMAYFDELLVDSSDSTPLMIVAKFKVEQAYRRLREERVRRADPFWAKLENQWLKEANMERRNDDNASDGRRAKGS